MITSSANPAEILEFPLELRSSSTTAVSASALQYFQQGMAELQEGNAALAVAALSQSVALSPAFADGRVFLGIAHSLSCEIYPAI